MIRNGYGRWVFAGALVLMLAAGCRTETTETIVPARLVSVSVVPAVPSLAPGTTLQLDAVGSYENNATKSIASSATWQSADQDIVTVDGSGLVTAHNAGSTTITVTSGSLGASTTVTVSPLVSIELTPADPTIASGTSVGFRATGTLLNKATQNITSFVTWGSANTAIALVNRSGVASALPSITGTSTITASFGTISGTTVLASAGVLSISATPLTSSIVLGTSRQFTATGVLTGGFTQDLTPAVLWISSVPTVATIGNATASPGLALSLSEGTTVITASFTGVTSNTAVLTVQPATLVSLSIEPRAVGIAVGAEQQFTATGTFSNGTTQDVTASAAWTSSAPQTVSVGNAAGTKGLARALTVGTATVSASFQGVTSNNAAVTVNAAQLVSITVSPANPTTIVGSGVQFTARGTFSDGTTQDLTNTATWSSSSGLAFISNATGSNGQAATSGAGTVTITATFGSVSGSTTLTITSF